MAAVPEGFRKIARLSPFNALVGHVGTRLAFANCYLVSGAKPIVRASAIFARDGKRE